MSPVREAMREKGEIVSFWTGRAFSDIRAAGGNLTDGMVNLYDGIKVLAVTSVIAALLPIVVMLRAERIASERELKARIQRAQLKAKTGGLIYDDRKANGEQHRIVIHQARAWQVYCWGMQRAANSLFY